jgi:hypothetical protein
MTAHKFKVGQAVIFSPARRTMLASSREYKIIRLLPPEGGQLQYLIKGVGETFERIAQENELSRRS